MLSLGLALEKKKYCPGTVIRWKQGQEPTHSLSVI